MGQINLNGKNYSKAKVPLTSIIDDSVISEGKTWSSYKIDGQIVPLPRPAAQDVGKVIEVVSDGEGGAEYRLTSKPDPMVYIGTLGVGGTAQSLPTVGPENNGWEYKVITAGTYADKTAKVGDMFISNGIIWDLIPSGDEKEPIQLSDTLIAGQTSITFQDARILGTSCIDVYAEAWYTGFTQSAGEATLTFPEQSTDMLVQIMVAN